MQYLKLTAPAFEGNFQQPFEIIAELSWVYLAPGGGVRSSTVGYHCSGTPSVCLSVCLSAEGEGGVRKGSVFFSGFFLSKNLGAYTSWKPFA